MVFVSLDSAVEEETSSKTTGHMTGSSYLNIYCIYIRLACVAWFANFNDFFSSA